eukprot:jgi/Galph1/2235/GphlegSOOS_G886.1
MAMDQERQTESVFVLLLPWLLVSTSIKLLLFPTYKSTDFEVHRYWKALTFSLPLSQWYVDDTSQWTLDYPPLFAVFEWCLSHLVVYVDPKLVQLSELEETWSFLDVIVMRCTVVASDVFLIHSIYLHLVLSYQKLASFDTTALSLTAFLFLLQPGLFIVDHIHFQYNGFLCSFLFYASYWLRKEKMVGFLVTVGIMVMMKQTFLYIIPISVWMVACQSITQRNNQSYSAFLLTMFQASILLLGIVLIVLSPWIYWNPLDVLSSRLFPFERGLLHAYWAPNFWACYGLIDQFMLKLTKQWFPKSSYASCISFATRGLVGVKHPFCILPNPCPWVCHSMVLLGMSPAFYYVWKTRKTEKNDQNMKTWMRASMIVWLSSFLFGWHVHEKAILIPQLCCCWLLMIDSKLYASFWYFSTTGTCSLLMLIDGCLEQWIVVILSW